MGAGASAQTESAAATPPKVKPTRSAATEKSLTFVYGADLRNCHNVRLTLPSSGDVL